MLEQLGGILDEVIDVTVEGLTTPFGPDQCGHRPELFTRLRPIAVAVVQAGKQITVIRLGQTGSHQLLQRRDRFREVSGRALGRIDDGKRPQVLGLGCRLLARSFAYFIVPWRLEEGQRFDTRLKILAFQEDRGEGTSCPGDFIRVLGCGGEGQDGGQLSLGFLGLARADQEIGVDAGDRRVVGPGFPGLLEPGARNVTPFRLLIRLIGLLVGEAQDAAIPGQVQRAPGPWAGPPRLP